jgi:hypothetical protein
MQVVSISKNITETEKIRINEMSDNSIMIKFKIDKEKWNYKADLKHGLLILYPKS